MRKSLGRLLLCLLLTIGCGDGGPEGLRPEEFTGEWVLNVAGNSSCAGAAAGGPQYFAVDASGAGQTANGDLTFNVVEEWDVVKPFRGLGFTVIGNFNLTARTVELNFWHTVMDVGAQFTGTIEDDGSIVGQLRDPRPGFDPHFVIGSCTFQASGHRLP